MEVYMENIGSSNSSLPAVKSALYRQLWLAPQYAPPQARVSPSVDQSMPLNFTGYFPREEHPIT